MTPEEPDVSTEKGGRPMTMASRNLGGLAETGGGGLAWWSYRPAAVAPGSVQVADGVAYQVDGGDPERLLAWSVESVDGLTALAGLLGEGEWTEAARAFAESGERRPTQLVMPQVPPAAARLGLVAAVRRWSVRPIDESLLAVDEALARHAAGRDEQAARLLSRSAPALVAYAHEVLDGDVPRPACDIVEAATTLAADLLPPTHPDSEEIRDLAVQMAARSALADLQLTWTSPLPDAVRVSRSGRSVSATTVDLSLVPPRVIAWHGALEPEVISVHLPEQDLLEVTVALAPDTLAGDADVAALTVSLTDAGSGRHWSGAGVRPDASGRGLIARLPLFGRHPDTLVVTLHSPERRPGMRATVRGRDFAVVERLAVESWNWGRTQQVLRAADLWRDAGELAAAAGRDVEDALSRLRELGSRGGPVASPGENPWDAISVPATFAMAVGVLDTSALQAALRSLEAWRDRTSPAAQSGPLLGEWDSVLRGEPGA